MTTQIRRHGDGSERACCHTVGRARRDHAPSVRQAVRHTSIEWTRTQAPPSGDLSATDTSIAELSLLQHRSCRHKYGGTAMDRSTPAAKASDGTAVATLHPSDKPSDTLASNGHVPTRPQAATSQPPIRASLSCPFCNTGRVDTSTAARRWARARMLPHRRPNEPWPRSIRPTSRPTP